MAAVGGSVESLTLSGRRFPMATDADITVKLGGTENEVQANGDGSVRLIKTRVPFMLDGNNVSIDNFQADHEFLQNLADANDLFAISVSYSSGAVYSGTGQITGELQYSTQNATASFSISGQLELVKQ